MSISYTFTNTRFYRITVIFLGVGFRIVMRNGGVFDFFPLDDRWWFNHRYIIFLAAALIRPPNGFARSGGAVRAVPANGPGLTLILTGAAAALRHVDQTRVRRNDRWWGVGGGHCGQRGRRSVVLGAARGDARSGYRGEMRVKERGHVRVRGRRGRGCGVAVAVIRLMMRVVMVVVSSRIVGMMVRSLMIVAGIVWDLMRGGGRGGRCGCRSRRTRRGRIRDHGRRSFAESRDGGRVVLGLWFNQEIDVSVIVVVAAVSGRSSLLLLLLLLMMYLIGRDGRIFLGFQNCEAKGKNGC